MLRTLARKRLSSMLSLSSYWKILILDDSSLSMVNSLLTVSDLHNYFVTTVVTMESNRKPIPDADAYYFISATDINIEMLVDNIENGMYNRYYLNFVSTITRKQLEDLCKKIKEIKKTSQIVSVYDQHLDFIPIEEYLAVVNENIITGIYSVIFSLNEKPIISYKESNVNLENTPLFNLTQQIKILSTKINNSSIPKTHTHPLLIYFDRSEDIITPLKHALSYNNLLKDLLEMNNNKIILTEDKEEKIININPDDEFWKEYSGKEITVAADQIEKELIKYKKKLEMNKNINFEEKKELTEQKERIDTHMILISKLMDIIKHRIYNEYNNHNIAVIKNKGSKEDIIRFILTNKHSKEIEDIKEDRNIKIDYTLYKEKDILSNIKNYIKKNKGIEVCNYLEQIISSLRNNTLRVNDEDLDENYSRIIYNKEINRIIIVITKITYEEYNGIIEISKKYDIEVLIITDEIINARRMLDLMGIEYN